MRKKVSGSILASIVLAGLVAFAAIQQRPSSNFYAGTIASPSPVSDIYVGNRLVTRDMGINTGTVRSVTAYNVGDPRQNHLNPCIGAGGDNLCALVEKGVRVCAANFVPLGSKLHVDKIGECIVLDRMNRRFRDKVDLAMKKSEHSRAVQFGVQRLNVTEVAGD